MSKIEGMKDEMDVFLEAYRARRQEARNRALAGRLKEPRSVEDLLCSLGRLSPAGRRIADLREFEKIS